MIGDWFQIHFSFSAWGLLILVLPLLPNIIWFLVPSHRYPAQALRVGKFWEIGEQGMRVLLIAGFLFLDNRPTASNWFLAAALPFLVAYDYCWVHYFLKRCDPNVFREKLLGIPAPMALFPVLYFMMTALWFQNGWLAAAALLFGAFHLCNALRVDGRLR